MPNPFFAIVVLLLVLLCPFTSNATDHENFLTYIIKLMVLRALIHTIGMEAPAAVNLFERLDLNGV